MKKKFGFALEEENIIPEISDSQKAEFIRGIHTHEAKIEKTNNLDPKAKPIYGINVRFNEYQMELIRNVCAKEERSQQQIIKKILVPALEERLSK